MLQLPFGTDDFFAVFAAYNRAVWPAPVLMPIVAAIAALLLRRSGRPGAGARLPVAILGALWMWSGIAYHVLHFAAINPAARVFGALFVLEGGLLVLRARPLGVAAQMDSAPDGQWPAGRAPTARALAGVLVLSYALVVYPLVLPLSGHAYPALPTFGAPCPVVIFTFGMFLLGGGRVPAHLLLIPVAWAVVGTSASFALGVIPDLGLAVSALVALPVLLHRRIPSTFARAG